MQYKYQVYDESDSIQVIHDKIKIFIEEMIELGENDGFYYSTKSSHNIWIDEKSPDRITGWDCELCGDNTEPLEDMLEYNFILPIQWLDFDIELARKLKNLED